MNMYLRLISSVRVCWLLSATYSIAAEDPRNLDAKALAPFQVKPSIDLVTGEVHSAVATCACARISRPACSRSLVMFRPQGAFRRRGSCAPQQHMERS